MHATGRNRFKTGTRKAMKSFDNYYGLTSMTREECPGHFGVLRKTRKFCSSPFCCGNPRRQKGVKNLTIQERKSQEISEEGAF